MKFLEPPTPLWPLFREFSKPLLIEGVNVGIEFSLGISQRTSYVSKFAFNGMGLNLGLTLENFDVGMQYYFPVNKSQTNFASNIFELYLIFEFTPFRRNSLGSFKRLQVNNY